MSGSTAIQRKCQVTYSGTFQGHALQGKLTRKRNAESSSLLGSADSPIPFLMIMDDDGTEMRFMDKPASKLHRFFTVQKLAI